MPTMAFVESILEQYLVNYYGTYAGMKSRYASSVSKYQISDRRNVVYLDLFIYYLVENYYDLTQ